MEIEIKSACYLDQIVKQVMNLYDFLLNPSSLEF